MNQTPNTTVVNQHILFLKDYAVPLAWLCNQTHRFIGGEHPKDIFVHAITSN